MQFKHTVKLSDNLPVSTLFQASSKKCGTTNQLQLIPITITYNRYKKQRNTAHVLHYFVINART